MWLWDPKFLSLVVLTLQNTCLVLTMRISRTRAGPMYLASVAVMLDEVTKLVFCVGMLFWAYRASPRNYELVSNQKDMKTESKNFVEFFKSEVFVSSFDFFKMAVPALCYALQKNMLYVAVSNLDAAVFQVAYQGKILTTAFFAVLILGKTMTKRQIFALFILLGGVILVQLSTMGDENQSKNGQNVLVGSLAVLLACCTSGFAAIYFEWILKKSPPSEQKPYSLWVRNFQLAFFAAIGAAIGVFTKDLEAVNKNGLMQGFNTLVWVVVILEAFGGIVVALVIKYADNILKNFATAVSIVTSVIISTIFLQFEIKFMFVFGSIMVMAAVVIYTSKTTKVDEKMSPKTVLEMKPESDKAEI